ncbi:hypothetical protein JVT61DRAFT_11303 [Boletus reticuloceps]|uniref:UBA domain-containing protein n=1 Tax=Boletus reticuloceps TaxID=495285 RepID=A0A8I2YEQ1_9AGAM|nr:hypothetical protein JVT61DRAFT_11303 [Boletus reticuloceps]
MFSTSTKLVLCRMSDSFADLWASSVPTKSTPQQPLKKVGSAAPPRRQQYDAFSILSASQPTSKPVTNNQPSDRQARHPQPASHGGDAFSDLFASSRDGNAASRNTDRVNMTMAERAVLAQKAKAQNNSVAAQMEPARSSSSLWDGLDALARPATASPRPSTPAQRNTAAGDSFDFGFDNAASTTTSPPNNPAIEGDDWGLSEFVSRPSESRSMPAPTQPVSGSQPTTALDEFGSSVPRTSHSQSWTPSRSLTGSPGDFDFGDREKGFLSGDNSEDAEDTFEVRGGHPEPSEDDILGDLGKPVSHPNLPSPNPSTSRGDAVRPPLMSASPPPHITGQLVEMGFAPVEARAALVNTMAENGFDVQAATELLLAQAGQEGSARLSPHPPDPQRRRNGDRGRDRDQAAPRPPRTDSHVQSPDPPPIHPQSQLQPDVTAEKLLSQATEIGRGMFSKANALWKEGKERAVKIYEERAATATNATNGAPTSDARPRWMRDRDHAGSVWQRPDRSIGRDVVQDEFNDDEDEEQETEQRERQRPPARRPPQSQAKPTLPRPEREREVDLFSSDPPTTAYQSPFRRGKSKLQAPRPSIQSSLSAPTLHTELPISTSSDPSTSQRQPPPRTFTTTIALSALTTSTSHKSAGTDAYKRGDFPVALAAYMRALSAFPPGHILRLPILTNVALVRSKVGELRDAIKACDEAAAIVRRFVGDLHASVDLVEGLSKAFRRRADALEGLEKWETARSTWEALLGAEWAGAAVKREAIKGVGRCRKMVEGGGADLATQSAPKPKPRTNAASHPRPKLTPQSSASLPPSAALTALRSTHNAQQTEDTARLECKDTVDARLSAWKSGREGNIRALVTSLDETVLWPELGWRKVSMAEVVSKGQVKGAYVRAIARVHPDKLNAGNTTVEQRLIANGVFGALNEAWNVFQQQQQ